MSKYQNSKIYKLVSPHTDEIYIGSTTQRLCHRLSGHKSDCKKIKNKSTSSKLFELGEVKIILIEECPCDNKEQLLKRERHHIENK
jgi:predicted GIY-YIG superfamily endonuclease